ncbi:hypothetical protein AB0F88_26700 [Streptosporangium sp. NPDC023963]|uniref:hypothetical protein n=1 Tax=Streptosporangium sp. NPDC023963 TaxID=3155608 RepID=UPI00341E6EED
MLDLPTLARPDLDALTVLTVLTGESVRGAGWDILRLPALVPGAGWDVLSPAPDTGGDEVI